MKPIAMRVIRGSTKCSAALPHVMSCGSQITGTRIYVPQLRKDKDRVRLCDKGPTPNAKNE